MKLHILNDLHIEFEDFEPPVIEIVGTRIVFNPPGYALEALNPDFRPDWIVAL